MHTLNNHSRCHSVTGTIKRTTLPRLRCRGKDWSPGHFHEPCPEEPPEERTPASVPGLQPKCIYLLTDTQPFLNGLYLEQSDTRDVPDIAGPE